MYALTILEHVSEKGYGKVYVYFVTALPKIRLLGESAHRLVRPLSQIKKKISISLCWSCNILQWSYQRTCSRWNAHLCTSSIPHKRVGAYLLWSVWPIFLSAFLCISRYTYLCMTPGKADASGCCAMPNSASNTTRRVCKNPQACIVQNPAASWDNKWRVAVIVPLNVQCDLVYCSEPTGTHSLMFESATKSVIKTWLATSVASNTI